VRAVTLRFAHALTHFRSKDTDNSTEDGRSSQRAFHETAGHQHDLYRQKSFAQHLSTTHLVCDGSLILSSIGGVNSERDSRRGSSMQIVRFVFLLFKFTLLVTKIFMEE